MRKTNSVMHTPTICDSYFQTLYSHASHSSQNQKTSNHSHFHCFYLVQLPIHFHCRYSLRQTNHYSSAQLEVLASVLYYQPYTQRLHHPAHPSRNQVSSPPVLHCHSYISSPDTEAGDRPMVRLHHHQVRLPSLRPILHLVCVADDAQLELQYTPNT
jgi:hypothetical protein